jgi:hypothetical protein
MVLSVVLQPRSNGLDELCIVGVTGSHPDNTQFIQAMFLKRSTLHFMQKIICQYSGCVAASGTTTFVVWN